jgi:hypothetical protein
MNEHDRLNLAFLLNADPAVLLDWMNIVTDDDILYAWELLEQYTFSLEEQILIDRIDEKLKDFSFYPDADKVLNRFTVKK